MSQNKTTLVYGYYSHNHATIPGCVVYVYQDLHGREILVTGTGSTKNPEDSGYNYPQTISVGRITYKWQLISSYRVAEKVYPPYLLDPEEQEAA